MHVEDVGVDLAVLARDTGDVGRQRMHKDGVLAVGGLLHELGRGAPILMRGVLSEQLLLECSDAGVVALGVQVGTLLHGGKRSPALGDHDVGALEGLGHGVDLLKGGAGLGGIALGALDDLGHEVVALGVGQGDVHAKTGQQADQRLRAGQRLAVRGRVGPGDGNLLALEVLKTAKLVDEVEHVGRGLRGVIGVGLQGDERGTVIQNAVLVSLLHGLGDLGHVGVALADVHVVADADDVGHEGDHVGRLTDRLAMGDLGLLLVEDLLLEAEEVAGGGEGEAGTGGVVAEEGDAEAGVEDLRGLVVLAQLAQGVGDDVERLELIGGLIPGVQEVAAVHALKIEAVQLLDELGKLGVHVNILSKDETIAMSRCAPACACG